MTIWTKNLQRVTQEDYDALRAEVERLRAIVQADLEEKAEAWGEVERLKAVLYRIADPLTIWPVATDRGNPWQEAARAALRPVTSPGVVHEGCNYLAEHDSICTKCGRLVQRQGTV